MHAIVILEHLTRTAGVHIKIMTQMSYFLVLLFYLRKKEDWEHSRTPNARSKSNLDPLLQKKSMVDMTFPLAAA